MEEKKKRGMARDLALKLLDIVNDVKDALDDLMETMFIIYQPKNYVGALNTNASFTVVAMNVNEYLWQRSDDDGLTWGTSTASGYNTNTLSFKATQSTYTRKWRCQLTDSDNNIIYTDVVGVYLPT